MAGNLNSARNGRRGFLGTQTGGLAVSTPESAYRANRHQLGNSIAAVVDVPFTCAEEVAIEHHIRRGCTGDNLRIVISDSRHER